jgi:hypothetical protein
LSQNHHNNKYNDDDDEHNDDYDEYNDDCNNTDEVFGGRNHSIEGHNPGYNVINTLSSIDRDMTKLPCYAELQEKCPSPSSCKFSHDFKLLQKTWSKKQEELNNSIYRPSITLLPRANTPVKPLRPITTEERGQVSTSEDNNTNELHHHLDRNSTVSSGDQRPKSALLEPYKGKAEVSEDISVEDIFSREIEYLQYPYDNSSLPSSILWGGQLRNSASIFLRSQKRSKSSIDLQHPMPIKIFDPGMHI